MDTVLLIKYYVNKHIPPLRLEFYWPFSLAAVPISFIFVVGAGKYVWITTVFDSLSVCSYRGTRPTKTFLVDEEKMADISVHEDVKCDQSHVVNPCECNLSLDLCRDGAVMLNNVVTPHFPPTVVSYTAFLSDSLPASHL